MLTKQPVSPTATAVQWKCECGKTVATRVWVYALKIIKVDCACGMVHTFIADPDDTKPRRRVCYSHSDRPAKPKKGRSSCTKRSP